MIITSRYRRKLFFYFFITVSIFVVLIAIFQFNREKNFKIEKLETLLRSYSSIINNHLEHSSSIDREQIDKLVNILNNDQLRISIVDNSGKVHYDSSVENPETMDNHISRIEIVEAKESGEGSSIRISNTTKIDYYYFAKKFENYFIRAALPYNSKVESFLEIDSFFLDTLLLVFIITIFSLIYFTEHLGKSIDKLKKFALSASAEDGIINEDIEFEKNELGDISSQIRSIYKKLVDAKKENEVEKNKLLTHLEISGEGVAFFTKHRTIQISNTHFNQFYNFITDSNSKTFDDLFEIEELKDIVTFLESDGFEELEGNENKLYRNRKFIINKSGRSFKIRVSIFEKKNFEIVVSDVTEEENYKKMKDQITSNISHELKTPVSVVSGYLETILNSSNLDISRFMIFVEKSYLQTKRLSSLINDISILNKIDEAGELYKFEKINILSVIKNISFDYEISFKESGIQFENLIEKDIYIEGNRFLIDSVFRNLIDNSIKYGGPNITIKVANNYEDKDLLYFTHEDSGSGVEPEHLSRLFERFYRVDKGRSRKVGGTGLGLSIVKHAVDLHRGKIFAKSEKGKGIKFYFSFRKVKES